MGEPYPWTLTRIILPEARGVIRGTALRFEKREPTGEVHPACHGPNAETGRRQAFTRVR